MALLAMLSDAVIYIFALSLLFFFANCLNRNPGAKWMGAGLLASSLLVMLLAFGFRIWDDGVDILFSAFDYLQLVSFLLMVAALVFAFFPKTELAVLLINLVAFVLLAVSRLGSQEQNGVQLHGYTLHSLLTLHIVLAGVSFVALTLGAVFAVLYLFLHHRLKKKKWSDTLRRLPSLESLDKYMPSAVIWGISLLAVSLLIAGIVILEERDWGAFLNLKVVSTFASFLVYLLYFIIRRHKRSSGTYMAKWVLLGYAIIIVNFLSNSLSGFHSWDWR